MTTVEYEYEVNGVGVFPIDMLRYDRAMPVREEDAGRIANTFFPRPGPGREPIRLLSHYPPTQGRWKSFGWTVLTVSERRY